MLACRDTLQKDWQMGHQGLRGMEGVEEEETGRDLEEMGEGVEGEGTALAEDLHLLDRPLDPNNILYLWTMAQMSHNASSLQKSPWQVLQPSAQSTPRYKFRWLFSILIWASSRISLALLKVSILPQRARIGQQPRFRRLCLISKCLHEPITPCLPLPSVGARACRIWPIMCLALNCFSAVKYLFTKMDVHLPCLLFNTFFGRLSLDLCKFAFNIQSVHKTRCLHCIGCLTGMISGTAMQGAEEPVWRYIDLKGEVQGPFPSSQMLGWFTRGYLDTLELPICGTVSIYIQTTYCHLSW